MKDYDKNKASCYTCKKFKTNSKSWISIKKVHRVIKFNQEGWL